MCRDNFLIISYKRNFGYWFGLKLNVPVNNFSVMLGRSHRFLGITSTFGGKYAFLKDTTRRLEWGSNPRPLDPESEVLTTRPPRLLTKEMTRNCNTNIPTHSFLKTKRNNSNYFNTYKPGVLFMGHRQAE